jgi:hypothetical protein
MSDRFTLFFCFHLFVLLERAKRWEKVLLWWGWWFGLDGDWDGRWV